MSAHVEQLELPLDNAADDPPPNVLRYSTNPHVGAKAGQPRRCIKCHRWLMPPDAAETLTAAPVTRASRQPGGVGALCKPCNAARYRARRAADPEAERSRSRARYTAHLEAERARYRDRSARRAARTDTEIAADRARLRPDGLKRCRRCHERLPLDQFAENRITSDGLNDKCRACDDGGSLRPRMAAYWSAVGQLDWMLARCYLCRGSLGDDWHVEHVIPRAAGGTDDVDNLMPACSACNLSKNARSVADILVERDPLWQRVRPGDPELELLRAAADPCLVPVVDELGEIAAWLRVPSAADADALRARVAEIARREVADPVWSADLDERIAALDGAPPSPKLPRLPQAR